MAGSRAKANIELQATKQRLEKRLADLADTTGMTDDLRAILAVFDTDLDAVLADLMTAPPGFNTFLRLFFDSLTSNTAARGEAGARENQRRSAASPTGPCRGPGGWSAPRGRRAIRSVLSLNFT